MHTTVNKTLVWVKVFPVLIKEYMSKSVVQQAEQDWDGELDCALWTNPVAQTITLSINS